MADELTTRGYAPADAPALADLLNAIEKAAGGHPGLTAEDCEAMVAGTIRDPAADTRLVFDAGGRLVAAGLIGSPPAGGFRVDVHGGVHPDVRGRGIGRELFAWQLARAAEIHRSLAPDAEWQVEGSAIVGDESANRLLERFGLTPARYFFEMRAPTAGARPGPLPGGLRSEPYRPDLERAVYATHMEAFSDHWGYQQREFEHWVTFTVRSNGFRPDLSRIAFDGDEIASYVLTYQDADPAVVYVGQVGTRRPWRRRGLASALLTEVLAAAAAAGKEFATLGVDADSPTGAVSVYERVGFHTEYRAVTYRKPLR